MDVSVHLQGVCAVGTFVKGSEYKDRNTIERHLNSTAK